MGSRSNWRIAVTYETAKDKTLPTILRTGNGRAALSPREIALLGWHPELTPPNEPLVSPDAKWPGTMGVFSEWRRAFPSTQPGMHTARYNRLQR